MKLVIKYLDLSEEKYKIDEVTEKDGKIIATRTRREIVFEYALSRAEDNAWRFSQRTYSWDFVCGGSITTILSWSIVK